MKCFFLVENFHFGRPKTNLSCFEKWKAKHLPFNNFTSFLIHSPPFPFFPCLFFPGRWAEISQSEVSGRGGGGRVPRLLRHCEMYTFSKNHFHQNMRYKVFSSYAASMCSTAHTDSINTLILKSYFIYWCIMFYQQTHDDNSISNGSEMLVLLNVM